MPREPLDVINAQPEIEHGIVHGRMLQASTDTMHRLTILPMMMRDMLRDNGWRKLVRPKDGKVFINPTVAAWVLGEPWPGLHFPDWETAFALVERNLKVGRECVELLINAGAPKRDQAARDFQVREAVAAGAQPKHGGDRKSQEARNQVSNTHLIDDGGVTRNMRRLLRDRSDLFEQVKAGKLSANAAAVQAGFRDATWSAPADPVKLAAAIAKRYPGWHMSLDAIPPAQHAQSPATATTRSTEPIPQAPMIARL